MSGVGCVTEETRRSRGIAEAAIAEAMSMRGQVESRVASLAVQAKASTAQVVGALSECVQEVAVHSEAQTLHVIGNITQRLEKDIEAAVVSTTTTSERNTRMAVEGLREEVKAQLAQNYTD